MKTLKFKAWHTTKNKLLFGTVDKYGGLVFVDPNDIYADEREEIGYRSDELEIMQYTGITDVDGREIYEGDIVSDGNDVENIEVKYNLQKACFEPLYNADLKEIKVVGSRYKI